MGLVHYWLNHEICSPRHRLVANTSCLWIRKYTYITLFIIGTEESTQETNRDQLWFSVDIDSQERINREKSIKTTVRLYQYYFFRSLKKCIKKSQNVLTSISRLTFSISQYSSERIVILKYQKFLLRTNLSLDLDRYRHLKMSRPSSLIKMH